MSIQLKRWTREQYDTMVAQGILGPESHVQLLDGEIIQMAPQRPLHSTAIRLVADALRGILPPGYHVREQAPLAAAEDSEPEPDVAVVRGAIRDYTSRHPTTAVLVVEVSDASLEFDRSRKQAVYARAAVPEYWILDLADRLEVCRDPDPGAGVYRRRQVLTPADEVTPTSFPAVRLPVSALLP